MEKTVYLGSNANPTAWRVTYGTHMVLVQSGVHKAVWCRDEYDDKRGHWLVAGVVPQHVLKSAKHLSDMMLAGLEVMS